MLKKIVIQRSYLDKKENMVQMESIIASLNDAIISQYGLDHQEYVYELEFIHNLLMIQEDIPLSWHIYNKIGLFFMDNFKIKTYIEVTYSIMKVDMSGKRIVGEHEKDRLKLIQGGKNEK